MRALCFRTTAIVVLALLPRLADAQGRRGAAAESYLDDLPNQETTWPVDPAFDQDIFTFARLKHGFGGGIGYGRRVSWAEDFPLADVMLPYRLHQITSLVVRPGPNPIDFTKEELARHPFVYMSGVERMALRDDEVALLRQYLLNGGFMMVDNFWGDAAWSNFAAQMKRVFPTREPAALALDHPVFHCVYEFKAKPQMPSTGVWMSYGIFYDPSRDYEVMGHDPHYFAIYDDKGRMMMIICHNNHFGDGWEHEGDDIRYFHIISEGMAYPMFINILVYAMGH